MDANEVYSQTKVVESAQLAVRETLRAIAQVSCNHGQDLANMTVNGVSFPITGLNKAYMPEVQEGMHEIQSLCLGLLRMKLAVDRSKLEGAQWKLQQLTKR